MYSTRRYPAPERLRNIGLGADVKTMTNSPITSFPGSLPAAMVQPMTEREIDLMERIWEDEGLVLGLSTEAADAVRRWCVARVQPVVVDHGQDSAARYVDEIVARVRIVTEIVNELDDGVPDDLLTTRLGRVVTDGADALRILVCDECPLERRLTTVLDNLQLPRVA